MKKTLLPILLICFVVPLYPQEGHKLNLGLDMSFGLHYFSGKINNPIAFSGNLGYEYDLNEFFGIELGIRGGRFHQSANYYTDSNILPNENVGDNKSLSEDVYRGSLWGPYIAPKIYIPIGYDDKHDRARYVFLENKFSYINSRLQMNKIDGEDGGTATANRFNYEIKLGYQYPLNERWAVQGWLGYNTFDFSRARKQVVRFKNTTPIQLGVGFNYVMKNRFK